jgi:hypothetical protein
MSDFMAVHTIENLQSIILMGVFLVSLIDPVDILDVTSPTLVCIAAEQP